MSITSNNLKVREIIHQVVNDPEYKAASSVPLISMHQLGLILLAYTGIFGGIALYLFAGASLWIVYPIMLFSFFTAFTPLHDSTHRALSSNKFLNDLLGTISATPLLPFATTGIYRYLHLSHHRYVGDKDWDPDDAWRIQMKKLRFQKKKRQLNRIPFFSVSNNIFWYTVIQWSAIFSVLAIAGWQTAFAFVVAGLTGSLLFELINYVEHYGLRRKQLSSGQYERVLPIHSWNDEYTVTGSILLNGMRHSDHHITYNKPYQILRNYPDIPSNLPVNSAAMMIMALIPPLFFSVMNPKLDEINRLREQADKAPVARHRKPVAV